MNRRLYRCRHDQRIAGVASGLAEYFDIDPTIVRVGWVLTFLMGGLGLVLYIVMAIIVPLEPEGDHAMDQTPLPVSHRHASRGTGRAATFFGALLILFGALALVDVFLPSWADGGRFLWPAFILGIGTILVVTAVRSERTQENQVTQTTTPPVQPTQPTES